MPRGKKKSLTTRPQSARQQIIALQKLFPTTEEGTQTESNSFANTNVPKRRKRGRRSVEIAVDDINRDTVHKQKISGSLKECYVNNDKRPVAKSSIELLPSENDDIPSPRSFGVDTGECLSSQVNVSGNGVNDDDSECGVFSWVRNASTENTPTLNDVAFKTTGGLIIMGQSSKFINASNYFKQLLNGRSKSELENGVSINRRLNTTKFSVIAQCINNDTLPNCSGKFPYYKYDVELLEEMCSLEFYKLSKEFTHFIFSNIELTCVIEVLQYLIERMNIDTESDEDISPNESEFMKYIGIGYHIIIETISKMIKYSANYDVRIDAFNDDIPDFVYKDIINAMLVI